MARQYKYYIMERDNYQSVYFVAYAQMSASAVKRRSSPIHGSNTFHAYNTKEEYSKAIEKLIAEKKQVQFQNP